MKTIVALVDFSDDTMRLVTQAAQFAQAFQGKLILLHSVPPEPSVVELGVASPTVMRAPSERKIEADFQSLQGIRESLASTGANVVVQQLEQAGADKVLAQCSALRADLIVVGSHHHGALYNLFVGTFTSEVLQHATCPVMVVPAPRAESA